VNGLRYDIPEIKAALERKGIRLSALAARHNYHVSAVGKTLRQPWPQVEEIIARALGETPQAIWPHRYNADGTPLKTLRSRKR